MPIALHRQVDNSRLVLHKNALESSAVWPDVGEKGSPIFSKSCPIRSQCSFYIRVRFFKIATKSCQSFGLLLLDILLPRTFKNRPIWSHCWCCCFQIFLRFLSRITLQSIGFSFSFVFFTKRGHSPGLFIVICSSDVQLTLNRGSSKVARSWILTLVILSWKRLLCA